MGNAKHIGRIGALAVALGVGFAVAAPPGVGHAASTDSDATALILCGTTCPTPDDFVVDAAMKQFVTPTHPGQTITPVKVTAPMEFWPISGLFRVVGLALGPPSLFGLGGPAWPDEPWWRLSGLFDLTADQSLQAGAADLEAAMTAHPDDHLIISGFSQGAGVANVVKKRLAAQYPAGTPEGDNAPDIDFVLVGDPNLPNGGLMSRFPGLYIPIVNLTFNGAAATDTPFDTVEINQQYDGFVDFPLYPLNVVADVNAVLGILYKHMYSLDVSLPADPTTSPAYQGKHGDTSYYFFETQDLPLFGPLRTLGVPEAVIDVVEPFFKVIVDLGYDRSIAPWEPTPARLIPPLDPAKLTTDLVKAIGEGVNNAAALIGLPPLLSTPAPVAAATAKPAATTATEAREAVASPPTTSTDTPADTEQVRSTETATGTQQISTDTATQTKDVTVTAKADEAMAKLKTVDVSDPPARGAAGKLVKQPARPAMPRPVVRPSLKVGAQVRDRLPGANRGHLTTRTAATDGARLAKGRSSSVAPSSAGSHTTGSDSSDDNSSNGGGESD